MAKATNLSALQSQKIPAHHHDMTTILSAADTQEYTRSSNQAVDFKTIDLDVQHLNLHPPYAGINWDSIQDTFNQESFTPVSFSDSDYFYDDFMNMERQILKEIKDRTNDVHHLFNLRASDSEFGLVKIQSGGGLVVDSETKKLSADFSLLQRKLIDDATKTGSQTPNFKTINGESLLRTSDSESTDIQLVTDSDLENAIRVSESGIDSKYSGLLGRMGTAEQDISDWAGTISDINTNVTNILSELYKVSSLNIGSGTISGVSNIICVDPLKNPSFDTCEDIMISPNISCYHKVVREDIGSCISTDAPNGTKWFNIDARGIQTEGREEYMSVKFELDLEITSSGIIPADGIRTRFPWEWWNDQSPTELYPGYNYIIEIRGIWKCGIWNWFGKIVFSHHIECSM